MFQIRLGDYLEVINILSIDKGIPPLSFEKMPFYWLEGYLEKYNEHIKQRIKDQDSSSPNAVDPSHKFREYKNVSDYKMPNFKTPKMPKM